MRSHSLRVACVSVLVAGACSSGHSSVTTGGPSRTSGSGTPTGSGSPAPPTGTTGALTPSPTAGTLTDQALVERIAVTTAQLGSGVTRRTPPGGDTVTHQVTLDLCGADFPSEGLRTARLQVIYSRAGAGFGSNEVVTYRTGGTAQAAAEVAHAVATCPHHPVTSKVAGTPLLTYTFTRLASRAPWPAGTLAYDSTATDGKTTEHVIGIYMWHDRVFSGVYGSADPHGQPTSDLLSLAAQAAKNLTAAR